MGPPGSISLVTWGRGPHIPRGMGPMLVIWSPPPPPPPIPSLSANHADKKLQDKTILATKLSVDTLPETDYTMNMHGGPKKKGGGGGGLTWAHTSSIVVKWAPRPHFSSDMGPGGPHIPRGMGPMLVIRSPPPPPPSHLESRCESC